MNGPYFGPCTTIRQYRDRDQDRQNRKDAELEAARQEADSFSFGRRHKLFNPRGEAAMSYKNPRIKLEDTTMVVLLKMAEGNPGALTVMMSLLKEGQAIDPDGAMGGLGVILSLDTHDIYGCRIWDLFKYVSGSNLTVMCALLRAVQLGYLPEAELNIAIDDKKMSAERVQEMVQKVKERLPAFGKTESVPAESGVSSKS